MWHGKVDLEVVPRRHVFAYLCILVGCFGDVPLGNMGGGKNDDDELKAIVP
jgi:hypothetical protein